MSRAHERAKFSVTCPRREPVQDDAIQGARSSGWRRRAGAPREPPRESEGVYSRVWRPIATGGPCAVLGSPPLLRTSRQHHRRRQHSHQQPPRSHAHLRQDYREHTASADQGALVCADAQPSGGDPAEATPLAIAVSLGRRDSGRVGSRVPSQREKEAQGDNHMYLSIFLSIYLSIYIYPIYSSICL